MKCFKRRLRRKHWAVHKFLSGLRGSKEEKWVLKIILILGARQQVVPTRMSKKFEKKSMNRRLSGIWFQSEHCTSHVLLLSMLHSVVHVLNISLGGCWQEYIPVIRVERSVQCGKHKLPMEQRQLGVVNNKIFLLCSTLQWQDIQMFVMTPELLIAGSYEY